MTETRDELLFLVYTSTATDALSDEVLDQIHARSRRNNERNGITGLLLHRRGRFIQALEGPEQPLRERMAVIAEDSRHTGVQTLIEEHGWRRRFPHWAMEYRPLSQAMIDSVPGYEPVFTELDRDRTDNRDGAENLGGADPTPIQRPLEALLRWYQARAAQTW